jgi:hypothetical protein
VELGGEYEDLGLRARPGARYCTPALSNRVRHALLTLTQSGPYFAYHELKNQGGLHTAVFAGASSITTPQYHASKGV